jgi:hypothetical protein
MNFHQKHNQNEKIRQSAHQYQSLGFSLLPLAPGSKIPAIPWKPYQNRQPTPHEIDTWFTAANNYELGLITGQVSGLTVIDFDTAPGYQRFRAALPNLFHTFTVQTRRGYHVYYRTGQLTDPIPSLKLDHVDVQSDGRYVVAYPSTVDGYSYFLYVPSKIYTLTDDDRAQLMGYLDELKSEPVYVLKQNAPPPAPPTADPPPPPQPDPKLQAADFSVDFAVALYRGQAKLRGRNNALFLVGCLCRDAGWGLDKAINVLSPVHISQPAPMGHRLETSDQRQAEAQTTLASAYNYLAKPLMPLPKIKRDLPDFDEDDASRLPNSVREALLAQNRTSLLRLLEGLYLKGVRPGDTFTQGGAIALLTGVVGAYSVRKALTETVASPSLEPTPLWTALPATDHTSNIVKFDRSAKPSKSRMGRPARVFVMPSHRELAKILGVRLTPGDPILLDDLRSVATYRAALHKRHIERRPGQYSRALLQSRLNVSYRTLRRYDVAAGLRVTPMYTRMLITHQNLRPLVPSSLEYVPPGMFLEDETGKRYPAKFKLAARLLKHKAAVYVVWQEPNHYAVLLPQAEIKPPDGYLWERQPLPAPPDPPQAASTPPQPSQPRIQPAITPQAPPVRGVRQTTLKPPMNPVKAIPLSEAELEYWAVRVSEQVNERVTDADKRLSKSSARALIHSFGLKAVRLALWILSQRKQVANPAGFVVTVARSQRPKGTPREIRHDGRQRRKRHRKP